MKKYFKFFLIGILTFFTAGLLTGIFYYFHPEKRKTRHFHRGLILLREKRYINASWEFRNALSFAPKDIKLLYYLAKSYSGNEDYEKAAESLETLLKIDPNYYNAYLFLSNIYLQQKKFQQALTICDEFLKIKPEDLDAGNERGIILWRMGYKKQAEYEFTKVIEKKADDVKGYLYLARLYWDTNQKKEAISTLENFLKQYDPQNFDISLELANYYVAERKYQQSFSIFKNLAQQNPDKILAIAPGYSYTLLSLGMLDEAYDIAEQGLSGKDPFELGNKDPILAYVRGVVRLERKQYSEAANDLILVQRHHNNLAEVHFHLGRCYFATKKYLQAIQSFENAIQISPNSSEITKYLLDALIQEKRYDRALEYANSYLEFDKKNAEILNLKAQILIQLNFHAEAEKILQSLSSNNPTLDSQISMALLENSRRNFTQAIDILKQLDKKLPNNFYIHFLLSQVYFTKKELGPALQYIYKSIEINSKYRPAQLLLIQIRMYQKAYQLAIVECEKLYKEDLEDESIILQLAKLYLANNQANNALKLLQDTGFEQSKDTNFLQCLGEIYFAKQEYIEALRYFKQVPPKDLTIYYFIGDSYFYLGRYFEALNHYEMAKIDNDPIALLRIAVTYYLQREWKLAIDTLEQYIVKQNDDRILIFLSINHLMDGQPELAKKRLQQVSDSSKACNWLKNLTYIGIYVVEENFIEAKNELQKLSLEYKALAEDFKNLIENCQKNRANFTPILGTLILRELGFIYAASIKCRESLQILNNHYVIETIYANLLIRLGQPTAAKEIWSKLSKKPIVSAYIWNELGQELYREKKLKEAEKYFQKALSIDPNIMESVLYLGMIYASQKNIQRALECFHHLIGLAEKNENKTILSKVYNNMACLNLESVPPQIKTGLQWAQKAIEKSPWEAATLDTLGWCYFYNQDYENAMKNLLYANKILPTEPTIYYHLAECYVKLNQTKEAIEAIKKSLEISQSFPELAKAKSLLKKLEKK